MIRVTRLNGEPFLVNAELIKYVEARPDTFLTLTTNDRVVVRESMDQVLARILDYQRGLRLLPRDSQENDVRECQPVAATVESTRSSPA
jgi:flagellar protein FlbD